MNKQRIELTLTEFLTICPKLTNLPEAIARFSYTSLLYKSLIAIPWAFFWIIFFSSIFNFFHRLQLLSSSSTPFIFKSCNNKFHKYQKDSNRIYTTRMHAKERNRSHRKHLKGGEARRVVTCHHRSVEPVSFLSLVCNFVSIARRHRCWTQICDWSQRKTLGSDANGALRCEEV